MTTATIGARYQVVIPARERRKLGLRPHDKVLVEATKDAIVIRPVGAAALRGIGSALGKRTDAVQYVRELRSEWETRT